VTRITTLRERFAPSFPTTHFGYRKITVERPLRLNFQASPERIAGLEVEEEKGFQALSESKKKGGAGEKERTEGRTQQEAIRKLVRSLPNTLFKDRNDFERALDDLAKKRGLKLAASVRKAILSALSERDETAAVCVNKEGNAEPDPELRGTESVPLVESVETFFAREVKPHVPDAWIDTDKCDLKDGKVGIVGYEINFNRYFYRYRSSLRSFNSVNQRSEPGIGLQLVTQRLGCFLEGLANNVVDNRDPRLDSLFSGLIFRASPCRSHILGRFPRGVMNDRSVLRR
jgi:hypothetical protein